MLSENIKILRKQKGYTQETLAQQLNVVRQTVSKWEKGVSVPDAEMLNTLSELFEVPVSQMLGNNIEENLDPDETNSKIDEIAKQLAVLNEQLANQAVRKRKNVKRIFAILGIALIGLFLSGVICFSALILFRYHKDSQLVMTEIDIECELDGETYGYNFYYDQNHLIHAEGGDAFISNHVDLTNCETVDEAIAHIEDYFEEHGGSVKIIGEMK